MSSSQISTSMGEPASQLSANAYAMLGEVIDASDALYLGITVLNTLNTITYKVEGANNRDFSDIVSVVTAADLVAGAVGKSGAVAYYAYYRVMIVSKVAETHGLVTLTWIKKG